MKFEEIVHKIKQHKAYPEGKYRLFGLLIPIVCIENRWHIVFEVRAHTLRSQPGEICLPGGGIENNELPEETAIRETCEELNIRPEDIEIIGATDYVVTPFNYALYPYMGILNNFDPSYDGFNKDEVAEVFTVPLDYFINHRPDKYYVSSRFEFLDDFPFHKIQNGKDYNWKVGKYPILFYEYKHHVIWGMTARIIQNVVEILEGKDHEWKE